MYDIIIMFLILNNIFRITYIDDNLVQKLCKGINNKNSKCGDIGMRFGQRT